MLRIVRAEKKMIKTDAQRERTLVQIEGFRSALAKTDQEASGKRATAIRGSYEGMIRQLKEEVREYDRSVQRRRITIATSFRR